MVGENSIGIRLVSSRTWESVGATSRFFLGSLPALILHFAAVEAHS